MPITREDMSFYEKFMQHFRKKIAPERNVEEKELPISRMTVAFDVDGTLINFDNTPNYDIIEICRWFIRQRHHVVIWSGGGFEYAKHWKEKLKLNGGMHRDDPEISAKNIFEAERLKPDICFDDEYVELAKVNIKITPNLTNIE